MINTGRTLQFYIYCSTLMFIQSCCAIKQGWTTPFIRLARSLIVLCMQFRDLPVQSLIQSSCYDRPSRNSDGCRRHMKALRMTGQSVPVCPSLSQPHMGCTFNIFSRSFGQCWVTIQQIFDFLKVFPGKNATWYWQKSTNAEFRKNN